MTLSLLFVLPHWWRTEKTTKRRLLTLPLLLMQIWPQYRVVKLLISLWNDQRKYHIKKEEYDRDVSCVGKKYLKYYSRPISTSKLLPNQFIKSEVSKGF